MFPGPVRESPGDCKRGICRTVPFFSGFAEAPGRISLLPVFAGFMRSSAGYKRSSRLEI